MKCCRTWLALAIPACLLAGCASRFAYVIAQRHAPVSPTLTTKITIASRNQPRPEDQALGEALKMEMQRQGFCIVQSAEADYTLVYWMENNWNPMVVPTTSAQYNSPAMTLCRPALVGPIPPGAPIFVVPVREDYRYVVQYLFLANAGGDAATLAFIGAIGADKIVLEPKYP